MVYPLAESPDVIAAMEAQMRGSYRMRTRVQLLDYRFRMLRELSSVVLGGGVQVDADSEGCTRSLSLELYDPTDMLGLSTGDRIANPARMVLAYRGIFVETGYRPATPAIDGGVYGTGIYGTGVYGADQPAIPGETLGYWIDVPVFAGPISKPDRSEDVLKIEARDKAAFALEPRATYTVKRGTNKATAIRQLMAATCGENRFRIASTSERMQADHTVDSKERSPWNLVRLICRSLGWVCFYDGGGYLVCKPRPTSLVAEFRSGNGGLLASEVQAGFWDQDIYNRVMVSGGVISRTTITATATLEESHPLSPENLATNGARWFKTLHIEDTNISSYNQALALARQRLLDVSRQQSTASFDSLPFWHLQEHDPFAVESADAMVQTRMSQSTIPLTCEGTQSWGYNMPTGRATQRPMRIAGKNPYLVKAERKVAAERRKAAAAAAKRRRK